MIRIHNFQNLQIDKFLFVMLCCPCVDIFQYTNVQRAERVKRNQHITIIKLKNWWSFPHNSNQNLIRSESVKLCQSMLNRLQHNSFTFWQNLRLNYSIHVYKNAWKFYFYDHVQTSRAGGLYKLYTSLIFSNSWSTTGSLTKEPTIVYLTPSSGLYTSCA